MDTSTSSKIMLHEYLNFISGFIMEQYLQPVPDRPDDFPVQLVTNDSRKVVKGAVFVAIRGAKADGHKFIGKAIENGAGAIIYQHDIGAPQAPGIPYVRVTDSYHSYALLVEKYFGCPTEKLKLIGITGTNGKTTSAYIIRAILSDAGHKVGLISTVNYQYAGKDIPADRTTPEAFELQGLFADMLAEGCTHVVMEVSSHSLDQHRLGHLRFDAALFTNLTGDHLDYHLTMENYFQAKKRLFTEYCDKDSACVVNCDDDYGCRLFSELEKNRNISGFSSSKFYKYRLDYSAKSTQSCINAIYEGTSGLPLKSNLIGAHNAYNIAGAVIVCLKLGISPEAAAATITKGISVPGRLEKVESSDGVLYFVDYAHTDDALARVLKALDKLDHKKLHVVFGCGGDRDRTKRPRMGRIAAELADEVIVTSDNPRTEEPVAIIDEIVKGIPRGRKYEVIPDRREAIHTAVAKAQKGDIVVIAGKGHEDYQEINGVKHPFDDRKIVMATLEQK